VDRLNDIPDVSDEAIKQVFTSPSQRPQTWRQRWYHSRMPESSLL